MKKLIKDWLGISHLEEHAYFAMQSLERIELNLRKLLTIEPKLAAALNEIGRLTTIIDPNYAKSEFDPEKKAESDRLGEEAIRRMLGEEQARRHTLGES